MIAIRCVSAALAASALTLAGCASPPNPALEQAAANYNAAAQAPAVVRSAPTELDKARSLLSSAQAAQAGGEDAAEVTHRAYLASQQTEVARQVARYNDAEALLKNAQSEQSQTLLSARTSQLEAERTRSRQLEQELNARQTAQGTVLTLGNVLFKTDRAELTAGAQESMDKLAAYLKANPGRSVTIDGYTDSTGSGAYNMSLSQRRADAVGSALFSRGVDPRLVVTQGHGEASPVADNSTAEGRQMNRRVEVVVANPPAATTGIGSSTAPAPMPSGTPNVPPPATPYRR
jgi:outer membrane protein OmpA-like peptidoglycan-associated protein